MDELPNTAQIPPNCFRLEELEVLQAAEGKVLEDVQYFLWLNRFEGEQPPLRFLYAVELVLENSPSLVVVADEEEPGLRVVDAESLIQTARDLQTLHGQISLQQVHAGAFPLWESVAGTFLEAVRLTREENGLYLNDALLLDFNQHRILVTLAEKEGLAVMPY